MNQKTAINHKNRAVQLLVDYYRTVEMFGASHDAITNKYIEVIKTLENCPQWVKSYVSGFNDATRSILERKLVFFYTMPDGNLVTTHKNREDCYEKLGYGPKEVYDKATHSGHYWVIKLINLDGTVTEKKVPYHVTPMEKNK